MDVSGGTWRIKYQGNMAQVHTLREFTIAEKEEDKLAAQLKGVRTFFFHALHWRGLPEILIRDDMQEKLPYDDFAWVPKRKMNEFLSKDYFDVFIHALMTRWDSSII